MLENKFCSAFPDKWVILFLPTVYISFAFYYPILCIIYFHYFQNGGKKFNLGSIDTFPFSSIYNFGFHFAHFSWYKFQKILISNIFNVLCKMIAVLQNSKVLQEENYLLVKLTKGCSCTSFNKFYQKKNGPILWELCSKMAEMIY